MIYFVKGYLWNKLSNGMFGLNEGSSHPQLIQNERTNIEKICLCPVAQLGLCLTMHTTFKLHLGKESSKQNCSSQTFSSVAYFGSHFKYFFHYSLLGMNDSFDYKSKQRKM